MPDSAPDVEISEVEVDIDENDPTYAELKAVMERFKAADNVSFSSVILRRATR